MNISKIVQKLEEIEADTHGEGRDKINSLIEELIELDIRLEKGFKQVLSKEKDEFMDKLFKEGIDSGLIGEA